MADGTTHGTHPLFNGGDEEAGRALSELITGCIPEKDYPEHGLSEELVYDIFDGKRGVAPEKVMAILAHFKSRWPSGWRTNHNYLAIERILNGEADNVEPQFEDQPTESVVEYLPGAGESADAEAASASIPVNGTPLCESDEPVEDAEADDVLSKEEVADFVARLARGCKEHGSNIRSVAIEVFNDGMHFAAAQRGQTRIERSSIDGIAKAADLPISYLIRPGSPDDQEVSEAVSMGYVPETTDEAVSEYDGAVGPAEEPKPPPEPEGPEDDDEASGDHAEEGLRANGAEAQEELERLRGALQTAESRAADAEARASAAEAQAEESGCSATELQGLLEAAQSEKNAAEERAGKAEQRADEAEAALAELRAKTEKSATTLTLLDALLEDPAVQAVLGENLEHLHELGVPKMEFARAFGRSTPPLNALHAGTCALWRKELGKFCDHFAISFEAFSVLCSRSLESEELSEMFTLEEA